MKGLRPKLLWIFVALGCIFSPCQFGGNASADSKDKVLYFLYGFRFLETIEAIGFLIVSLLQWASPFDRRLGIAENSHFSCRNSIVAIWLLEAAFAQDVWFVFCGLRSMEVDIIDIRIEPCPCSMAVLKLLR